MKIKNYFEKYINFSLISNCVVFNTLAGCNKKKGGKGCSSSGKDKKDPTIINNEQGTSGDENNQGQDDEEKKKKEQEDKEKADKLAKENAEKLAYNNKKDGLIAEYKKLKADFDNLDKVAPKFFEIKGFKIVLTEKEINSCDKNTIDSVEKKLNTDKTNFNNNLQTQFGVLKDKYTEINTNKGDNEFDVTKIENIIKKDKIKVDEFISLNSDLVSYDQLVKNGVKGYKDTILKKYEEKDKYKVKFELAKMINGTFENNFDTLYDNVSTLTKFNEIQSNVNTLNEQDEKANKIINDKKAALDNEIKNKKEEYKQLFSDYLLDQVKIEPKKFDDLNTDNFTEVGHLNNINNKLAELKTEINNIKNNFATIFTTGFKKILDKTKGFNLIDLIKKFFIIKKSHKCTEDISTKLSDAVKNYLDKNIFANDIYIELITDENKKTKLIKYNCYDSFVTPTCIDLKNDDSILNDKKKYSAYYTFENFIHDNDKKSGTDELKNIHINCNDLLKDIGNDKSYVLFYIKKDGQYHLFLFISNDKSLGGFFKDDYIKDKNITKFEILEISKNIENLSCFFKNFTNLKEINFPETFNTSDVTNMENMFLNCKNLTNINLSYFNTSNVTTMEKMFANCENLQEIKFPETFNTGNVNKVNNMFFNCKKLNELDLTNFASLNAKKLICMFSGCESLQKIIFPKKFIIKDNETYYMFKNCKNLEKINDDVKAELIKENNDIFKGTKIKNA